jgi:hypothetical protein
MYEILRSNLRKQPTFSQKLGSSISRGSSPPSDVITNEALAKLEPAIVGLDEY